MKLKKIFQCNFVRIMTRFLLYVLVTSTISWQAGSEETNKYDNYALIQVVPNDDTQLEVLKQFNEPEVEVLKRSYGLNDSLDILVPRTRRDFVKDFATQHKLDLVVKNERYGRSFETLDVQLGRRFYRGFEVYAYNSYGAIQDHLEMIARGRPELVTVVNAGNSFQDRRLKLVKISSNPKANNPIIFVDAGIHAREWVAPAMAMYLIDRLVMDPEALDNELNGVDWYILPLVNPDGYEYTRASRNNRLWRKTRSKTKFHNCFGVDGNRNYGFKWGVSGISTNPCDQETYAGPKPFSEAETRTVKNIMMENANRIKLYVSLHAYGQYLVYPWGYTGGSLPNSWKRLNSLARKVSSAVQNAGGKPFRVMSAGQWYPAAGGSDDFAFGGVGIPYSYTMELTEGYEFQFPESNLKAVMPQFYEGFKVFADQIRREFGQKYGRINMDFTKIMPDDKCQEVRQCYAEMWKKLLGPQEAKCVKDASAGTSTYVVFLKAIQKFCPDFVNVTTEHFTTENRNLNEVVINEELENKEEEKKKPVILIDAGQQAGIPPVMFALYLIEQLVACEDLSDFIRDVKWVILPSINPDGMEFSRINDNIWYKNTHTDNKHFSNGVDISRNFDHKWDVCPPVHGTSDFYPGTKANTEPETVFVKSILQKHKKNLKAYISLRRDGHGIFYPYSYGKDKPKGLDTLVQGAGFISTRVNQKAGGVQTFLNQSIYDNNGVPSCGNSVDYALDMNIPLVYEMRVFMGKDENMLSFFHALPKGFASTLRSGYLSGIKELFYIVSDSAKYKMKF